LHNGTTLEKVVDYARGMPQRPLTPTDLEAKFSRLAASKADNLAGLIADSWQFDDVRALMQQLAGAGQPNRIDYGKI
jgi:2-methylcitrate dehydratase PrpD